MAKRNVIVPTKCPGCEERVEVEASVYHDPGCYRTANGDGWPESWEMDVIGPNKCECGQDLETESFWEDVWEAFQKGLDE